MPRIYMSFEIPIVLITFIREVETLRTFNKIKEIKPKKLYFVSDGPRNQQDKEKIDICRDYIKMIDWDCECIPVFSNENLGCKKRVISALNYVFEREDCAIILEDDCLPTNEFFEFMNWGLKKYVNEESIGIISGSNLVDYNFSSTKYLNGFSNFINCWGWGTWKRTWDKYDELLSLYSLNKSKIIENKAYLSFYEKKYWKQIIKNAIMSNTVWDFYMQYTFFYYGFKSVYPTKNLVENIGFSNESTHMKKIPDYVIKSKPHELEGFMNLNENNNFNVDIDRDKFILKTLYGFNLFSLLKLYIGNFLRFLGIRKV